MKRMITTLALAALMLLGGGGAAFAGETTGPSGGGTSLEPLHANSICAYSGLNDDPAGADPANGPAGRTQSFGQDVRSGAIDPTIFNPGDACRGGSL
jgi:hypothetical protein